MVKDLRNFIARAEEKGYERESVDPEIHTGDEVIIDVKYASLEGVKGKVILEEKGRWGDMQRIVFQCDGHKENEYDVLYLNGAEGCWKSDCWDYAHNKKDMLKYSREDLEADQFDGILKFLRKRGVDIIAVSELPN